MLTKQQYNVYEDTIVTMSDKFIDEVIEKKSKPFGFTGPLPSEKQNEAKHEKRTKTYQVNMRWLLGDLTRDKP